MTKDKQGMAALSLAFPRASVRSQQLRARLLQLNACVAEIRRKLGDP